MPGQSTKVGALFAGGLGILLLWSGITGKSWSAVLKDLLKGQSPANLPLLNQINQPAGYGAGALGGSGGPGSPPGSLPGGTGRLNATTWAADLLKYMGAPQNNANIVSLTGWQAREGGGGANNPLNTTLACCGATGSFNSVGVKNYPTPAAGIQATALTLKGGNYPLIYMSLMAGRGLCGGSFASEFLTWNGGGPSGYTSVC